MSTFVTGIFIIKSILILYITAALINFASEYPITLSDRVSVKVNRDNCIMKFLEGGVIISLQREA